MREGCGNGFDEITPQALTMTGGGNSYTRKFSNSQMSSTASITCTESVSVKSKSLLATELDRLFPLWQW